MGRTPSVAVPILELGGMMETIDDTTIEAKLKVMLKGLVSGFLKLGCCAIAMAGIIAIQKPRLQSITAVTIATEESQREESVRLSVLSRMPSFGFGNLLAGWTFLNLVQYDGDTDTRKQVGYSLAPMYFETMTRFDPRFVDSYIFLSGIMSYQMGKPEEAIALMERGTQALTPQADPRAYLVWRIKGLDQLLMLGDTVNSAKSYDQAGDWALQSTDPDSRRVGPIFKQTAEFLRTDPNNRTLLLWSWTTIFDQAVVTRDVKTQERARSELLKIGAIERKDDKNMSYFTLPPQPKAMPKASPSPQPSPQSTPRS
jgi:hypothetical protein